MFNAGCRRSLMCAVPKADIDPLHRISDEDTGCTTCISSPSLLIPGNAFNPQNLTSQKDGMPHHPSACLPAGPPTQQLPAQRRCRQWPRTSALQSGVPAHPGHPSCLRSLSVPVGHQWCMRLLLSPCHLRAHVAHAAKQDFPRSAHSKSRYPGTQAVSA